MADGEKRSVLGILVNAIDRKGAVATIIDSAACGRGLSVSALAVHGIMTGVQDSEHKYRLNHLDVVVPDGQPVRWALNLLHGTSLPDRVCGPDLMLDICAAAAERGLPVYLYGSRPETLLRLTARLARRFPDLIIAGSRPSRFRCLTAGEKAEVIDDIRRSGAAIVFVGLGCPRQEVWAYEYRQALDTPIIAVGAAFDYHAGLLKRAPASMQRAGLEWLYRFLQEPRRLWQRYLVLNPIYVTLLGVQSVRPRKFDVNAATPPTRELMYG